MAPSPTEIALKVNPTDKWYERCLKLMARVDWRGLAIVLGVLTGIVGAVWNKLDAALEKTLASRTQQGVYEVLATKLDDVALRLTALEAAHATKGTPTPAAPDKPKPVPGSELGRAPASAPPDASVVTVIDVSEPAFPAAQLPSFQTIQRQAQELPRRDPPMAVAAPPPGT
jgi:hypothetical protein